MRLGFRNQRVLVEHLLLALETRERAAQLLFGFELVAVARQQPLPQQGRDEHQQRDRMDHERGGQPHRRKLLDHEPGQRLGQQDAEQSPEK